MAEVEKRFKEGVPLLDPAEDQGIKDSALRKAQRCAFCASEQQMQTQLAHRISAVCR